jgi:hypothetical protein
MVQDAVREDPALARRSIKVFGQGSYRANTNVRLNSDVDICVCCTDTIHFDFASVGGLTIEGLGFSPATYDYAAFKSELQQALVRKFGYASVNRGSKAFDVHANTYRVDADVVPAFELRRYDSPTHFVTGTYISPDSGYAIHNFPEQQYSEGVNKNMRTGRRYKQVVLACSPKSDPVGMRVSTAPSGQGDSDVEFEET